MNKKKAAAISKEKLGKTGSKITKRPKIKDGHFATETQLINDQWKKTTTGIKQAHANQVWERGRRTLIRNNEGRCTYVLK